MFRTKSNHYNINHIAVLLCFFSRHDGKRNPEVSKVPFKYYSTFYCKITTKSLENSRNDTFFPYLVF